MRANSRHLGAYWDEVCWRAFHQDNPGAFRETVIALLGHPPLTYRRLISKTRAEPTYAPAFRPSLRRPVGDMKEAA